MDEWFNERVYTSRSVENVKTSGLVFGDKI